MNTNTLVNISVILTVLLFAQQCDKEDLPKRTPACIEAKIQEIAESEVWNPPAKIYSYVYKGQRVYYITSRCCDFPSQLYDEDCNLICAPDGGFSGKGDNKCPNFAEARKFEKLVWEDTRNP